MDFDRFYLWRREFAIIEMFDAPIKPATCHRVYEELIEAKVAVKGTDGCYRLTKGVDVDLARSRARRLMNELVRDNQRLVRKLVSQLSKRSTAYLEEEDLFQAGCIGFMRALQSFDPEKFSEKKVGASFATYLRHWVRHFIQASTADQQTIKHPRSFGMPYVVHKRMEDFEQKHGRKALPEELGTYKRANKKGEAPVTQEILQGWEAAGNSIVSLDSLGNTRGNPDMTYNGVNNNLDTDFVAKGEIPDSSKSPESLLRRAQLGVKAEQVAASLPEDERELLEEIREGVGVTKIARRLKVTEEYARRLRRDLIEKVRKMMEKVS